jgi:zinc protease
MIKKLFIFILFLLLSLSRLFAFENTTEVFELKNGLKVLVQKDNTIPLLVMQLWVKHGSVDEKDNEAGFAHFLEHLTFRSKDIAKRIEDLGGDINAYTSFDRTVYYLTIPSEHMEVGLKVLYDIFQETNFDEKSFEEEKKVILEEMKRGYDNPQRMLYQKFFETALENHPAKRPVIGYEETIRQAKVKEVENFYRSYYTTASSFLVIVGDFEMSLLERKVEEIFGKVSIRANTFENNKFIEKDYNKPKISYKTMNVNSCYIMMGVPAPDIYSPFVPALDVLSYLIGESPNSLLNIRLKEELQLVNYVYSYQMNLRDLGFFVVQANMGCENVEKTTEELIKILFKERLNIEKEKLRKVIRNYESNYYFSKEKLSDRASDIGSSYHFFRDVDYSRKYIEAVNKVDMEALKEVKERFFKPEKLVFTLVLPEKEIGIAKKISMNIENFLFQKKEFKSFKISNGLQVYVNYRKQVPTFGVSIISLAGTRIEDKNTAGLSNFTISNLLRGTKKSNYRELQERIERIGGSLSGFSTKNFSGIKGRFLSKDFEEAIDIISEILNEFDPPVEEIEKTRRLIIADIKKKKESPNRVVRDLYFNAMFGDVPPGLPTEGLEESISTFSKEDVTKHFRKIFDPTNMVLTLSGDLPEDIETLLEKKFGILKTDSSTFCRIRKPTPAKNFVEERHEYNQSHIMIGLSVPGMGSFEHVNFQVLATILSNQSGRLFINLRDKEGLAYALGAFLYDFPESSLFTLYMGTSPEKTERAIKGMKEELKKLIKEGFDDSELEKAKRKILTDLQESMQDNLDYAMTISQNALIYNNPLYYIEFSERVKKITKGEILKTIEKWIDENKLITVVVHGKHFKEKEK